MELAGYKLRLNRKQCSLPSFRPQKENVMWLTRFQKQHTQLEKKVKTNNKVELVFEDMMSMMRINRQYSQTQSKFMGIRTQTRKDSILPRLKGDQMSTAEDEDETFKRFQGMCTGLEEYKSKQKNKKIRKSRRSMIRQQDQITVIKNKEKQLKKFPRFDSMFGDSNKVQQVQNSLKEFLKKKEKERYREKISLEKSSQVFSVNASRIPGEYVPTQLMKTLQRRPNDKSFRSFDRII